MKSMARQAGISPDKPFADLPQKVQDSFFYGSKERLSLRYGAYEYKTDWKGAVPYLMARAEDMKSESGSARVRSADIADRVPVVQGRRLQPASLAVRVGGRAIADYTAIPSRNRSRSLTESS